jgi:iron(III) transport system ATP-binding protein
VTHDPAEALAVADQVSIINAGRIVQTGPPEELHARPTTSLAARVLGDSNLLAGDAADGAVSTALGPLQLDSGSPAGPVTVLVRPTQILIHPDESPGTIPARVLRSEFRGEDFASSSKSAESSSRSLRSAIHCGHRIQRCTLRSGAAHTSLPTSTGR